MSSALRYAIALSAIVCFAIALSAIAFSASGCGDATHTVGQLAPERARGTPSASTAAGSGGGGNNEASDSTDASISTSAGDVGSADASVAPLNDAIVMLGAPFSCTGTSTPAVRRRLDLYLMIDTNLFYTVGTTITGPLNNAWTQIARGLSDYVDDPRAAGTGVGAGYFPAPVSVPGANVACDSGSYDSPVTAVELLPQNAAAIKRGIPAPLGLGSPTLPALEGAFEYEHSRAESWSYKQAIVLITDKIADFACFSDPNAIVTVARNAAMTAPGIPTYVIALSSPGLENVLSTFVRFEALEQVAAQGGTGSIRDVDLDDRNDSLSQALLDTQHDAEPCQYEVGDDVRADPTGIALGTVASGMDPLALPKLDSAADCGVGYYFDDVAQPQWATLCRDTCDALKASSREVTWLNDCDMPH